jgi:hypothetical protein
LREHDKSLSYAFDNSKKQATFGFGISDGSNRSQMTLAVPVQDA